MGLFVHFPMAHIKSNKGGGGYIYEHSTVMKVLLYKYLKRPNPSMPTPKENI
jgi:hypothetical protein